MRRLLLASAAALAALASSIASAQTTLKVVMHSDVKVLDPIWSGAYITRNHGYMLYDTLFAMDEKFAIKPQMVESWTTSPDGLTWTFKLREGLEWHDGQPVTAEDCIASLKRWSARDSMGQKLAQALQEYKAVDASTFQIVLKEKFGQLIESIGKVVSVDRVEWVWIADAETQVNALTNGEIDMIESVSYDHLPILEKNKAVKVIPNAVSNQYVFRMNWLQPPFNNAKIRHAAAMTMNQEDFLQANIGDKRFYRTCKAMFTCETPLATTAGMDGLVEGNSAKAKQMLAEAGYDGTPVTLLYPTDLGVIKQLGPVAKAALEKAGFKVDLVPMDWQSLVTRLSTKKGPPSEGGWNAFSTSWSQVDILDPLMTPYLASNCEKARPGWPCDEAMEKLRDKFVKAETPAEKKAVAEEVQRHAMQIVTHVPLGEWFGASVVRANIGTMAVPPPVTVFWGMTKK